MFIKYGSTIFHHDNIRVMVRLSHSVSSDLFPIMFSIVAAQWRLYGTIKSGNSWWIRRHLPQYIRRIMYISHFSASFFSFRCRNPRTVSSSLHIGQIPDSFGFTKKYTALFHEAVVACYYHHSPSMMYSIHHFGSARVFRSMFSTAPRCGTFPSADRRNGTIHPACPPYRGTAFGVNGTIAFGD